MSDQRIDQTRTVSHQYPVTILGDGSLDSAFAFAGVSSNVFLSLDAGVAASYTSTGTQWLDTSGNGYNFNPVSLTAMPSFEGVTGDLDSYIINKNGQGYFNYSSAANPSQIEDIHKDNANFTLCSWIWKTPVTVSTTAHGMGGTGSLTTTSVGFYWASITVNNVRFIVTNGSTGYAFGWDGVVSAPTGQWLFIATSLNEAVGPNGAFSYVNGNTVFRDSTYTTPTSCSATATMKVFGTAVGNGPNIMQLGDKMACFGMLNRALSTGECNAIFDAMRDRFGV